MVMVLNTQKSIWNNKNKQETGKNQISCHKCQKNNHKYLNRCNNILFNKKEYLCLNPQLGTKILSGMKQHYN
jgi:hypothetical protein